MRLQYSLLYDLLHGSTLFHKVAVLNKATDAFVEKLLSEWGSPGGVGIAVVRQDPIGNWDVETKGYGVATANGSRVTENTLFAMGSNSKLFTALATGLLINNETITPRLSWTSKIASVIPGWGLEDPFATKHASIIDLMSYRTGLPRHDISYKWSDDVPSIIKKLKFQRPSTEFRDVFQYNNHMYVVLGYLPTILLPSKIPFARYVKQHILDPLGLSSTTYSYDVAKLGHLADGFTIQREGINYSGNPLVGTPKTFPYWSTIGGEDGNIVSAAGGLISNAVDMAKWLQMLLLNGMKPGTYTEIVSADILGVVSGGITVFESKAAWPELSSSVYGGGQVRSTYRGHEVVEHSGLVTGFNTLVTRLPFDSLGIAVLSNDLDYGAFIINIIKYRLIDEALGLEKVDWDSRIRQSLPPPPVLPARPAHPTFPPRLFSLASNYSNAAYGILELCYVFPEYTAQSSSCQDLTGNLSTILPGAVEQGIPTFIARWDSPWCSHIRLRHFDGYFFNISILLSVPSMGDDPEPFWTYDSSPKIFESGEYAVFGTSGRPFSTGLAMFGAWGAGAGTPSPEGIFLHDIAEIWFEKG